MSWEQQQQLRLQLRMLVSFFESVTDDCTVLKSIYQPSSLKHLVCTLKYKIMRRDMVVPTRAERWMTSFSLNSNTKPFGEQLTSSS